MERRRLELVVLRALLGLGLLAGAVELVVRWTGHDFAAAEREALPPVFREDLKHCMRGRSQRPVCWDGQPLRARLRQQGLDDASQRDEAVVHLSYGEDGFRDEVRPTDWRVAVAGDELTEQGELPAEELFTTHLGALLGAPVRNLGCAGTSTTQQVADLHRHGRAPGCTAWVVVFSERDDLAELADEELVRSGARQTRPPVLRSRRSPTYALGLAIRDLVMPPADPINAYVLGAGVTDLPVSLCATPPAPDRLTRGVKALFAGALEDYRDRAADAGVEPWLAYMPAKERLYHGLGKLELIMPPSHIANWRPNDLPAWVGEACARAGVRFVDLTPDLAHEAAAAFRARRPLPFHDVHFHTLRASGSRVVAATLARALGAAKQP